MESKSNGQKRAKVGDNKHKRGQFTLSEHSLLVSALEEYITSNAKGQSTYLKVANLNEIDPRAVDIQLVFQHPKEFKGVWNYVSEKIAGRDKKQLYDYARRKIRKFARSGRWSDEEVAALKRLYQAHGRAWSIMSRELSRSEDSIRDKYRSLGDDLFFSAPDSEAAGLIKKGAWSDNEITILLNAIKEVHGGDLPSQNVHWNVVVKQVKTRSHDQCRSKYYNHLLPLVLQGVDPYDTKNVSTNKFKWNKDTDFQLIKEVGTQIEELKISSPKEVNYQSIQTVLKLGIRKTRQRWRSLLESSLKNSNLADNNTNTPEIGKKRKESLTDLTRRYVYNNRTLNESLYAQFLFIVDYHNRMYNGPSMITSNIYLKLESVYKQVMADHGGRNGVDTSVFKHVLQSSFSNLYNQLSSVDDADYLDGTVEGYLLYKKYLGSNPVAF